MALFSSLGQGDVWSINGINFASPVNDILDKEVYTIEELLGETELIQEVKTGNQRLLQFLFCDEIIEKLVYYIVTPPPKDADDLRSFKYPYMSCEIFCCEVPYISEALVQPKYLNQLFSILNTESELDHYLAGYFEKVLEMLFRRMTVPMMSFLNEGGIPLLKKFLYHIYNYSIMQIVQRVMLPHIPFTDIENLSQSEKLLHQCDWSFKKETCDLLCDCMLNPRTADVPSHVSDMLITVLQLSPHESSFLLNIYNSNILTQLLETAFSLNDNKDNNNNNKDDNNNNNNKDNKDNSSSGNSENTDSIIKDQNENDNNSETKNNVVLASISILESLISRLCETVNPFEYSNNGNSNDPNGNNNGTDQKLISNLQSAENIERITKSLVGYIPYLTKGLEAYLNPIHEPIVKESLEVIENEIRDHTKIYSQTGQAYTKLSSKGLQLVRFVESLVRLANDEMDEALCVNGTLKVCMELMFSYELHSLLHLSVQRIVLILFEGGANERTIRYLLEDCELINRIISIVSEESATNGTPKRVAGLRRPIVGHIITIGQSISTTLHGGNNDSIDGSVQGDFNSGRPADTILRRVMVETGLIEKWELFENQELHSFLEKQVAIGVNDKGLEASPQSHSKLQLEMALEALALNDNSNNWPPANKLDDDDIPTRHTDTIDIDDDDDDDDNEYAIYHYNQNHRYNQSNDNNFNDFEAAPTFDAAFADFSTVNNNTTSSTLQDNQFEPAFEATFDTPTDNFASFQDSSFPDSSWSIPTQTSNPPGNDVFDPFGIGSSF